MQVNVKAKPGKGLSVTKFLPALGGATLSTGKNLRDFLRSTVGAKKTRMAIKSAAGAERSTYYIRAIVRATQFGVEEVDHCVCVDNFNSFNHVNLGV